MKLTDAECSNDDQLRGYLQGDLNERESQIIEAHLGLCRICQRRVERASADNRMWQEASALLGQSRWRTYLHDVLTPEQKSLESDHDPAHKIAGNQLNSLLGSLAPTDDPMMLGRIDDYEISGVVGCGGMGAVLKGHDRALNRVVAIKVMAPHLAGSAAARTRFRREAQAASAITHDNVVDIYGVSEFDDLPYLVMPYARGPSLQKRLDEQGAFSVPETLRIGIQIAKGLAAAHAQGLVHRDIKPANILVTEGADRLLITDFGLARAVDDASVTRTGVIAGTPQYMSPEQARGESVDARSDLFSMGSVLYTLCTGRLPFRAESTYGILRRITDNEPRPIREINPEIPFWLCSAIEKLMAKNSAERFQSASEVAELLEDCLAHFQQPEATPLPASVTSVSNRKKFSLGYAIATMLGLLLLLPIVLFLSAGDEQQLLHQGPVAMVLVESRHPEVNGSGFFPIDAKGTLCETSGLSRTDIGNYIRISVPKVYPVGNVGEPFGNAWVESAAKIAKLLVPLRKELRIASIEMFDVESDVPQFQIKTEDGLCVFWGSPPGLALPDEANAETKVESLKQGELKDNRDLRKLGNQLGGVEFALTQFDRKAEKESSLPDTLQALITGPDGTVVEYFQEGKYRSSLPLRLNVADTKPNSPLVLIIQNPDHGQLKVRLEYLPSRETANWVDHNAVTLAITNADFEHCMAGNGQSKVVFLNNKANALAGLETIASSRLDPEGLLLGKARERGVPILYAQFESTVGGKTKWELEHLFHKAHAQGIDCVSFSPDGKTIASASDDKTVKLWNVETHRLIRTLHRDVNCNRVAFSPDGNLLAIAGGDHGKDPVGEVLIWDLDRFAAKYVLESHTDARFSYAVAFSPDGKWLASGGVAGVVKLWDVTTGELMWEADGHEGLISQVAFSADGNSLASSCFDDTIRFWKTHDGTVDGKSLKHDGDVRDIAFTADGQKLVSVGEDKLARVWDVESRKERKNQNDSFDLHSAWVLSVACAPIGDVVATGDGDGRIRIWDCETMGWDDPTPIARQTSTVSSIAFSPDGTRIAVAGGRNSFQVWKRVTAEE